MEVFYTNLFNKQIKKLLDKKLKLKITEALINIESVSRISEINNLEDIKEHKGYFRIRVGDYRIGIEIVGKVVYILSVEHRNEIYKNFPPK